MWYLHWFQESEWGVMNRFDASAYVAVIDIACNKLSHVALVVVACQECKGFFSAPMSCSGGVMCMLHDR